MKTSRVTSVDRASQRDTGNGVIQLATENPHLSLQIPANGPHPAIGDAISWTTQHVEWAGHRVRKLGYEIDPYAPLS
jgi:hypothetical protein